MKAQAFFNNATGHIRLELTDRLGITTRVHFECLDSLLGYLSTTGAQLCINDCHTEE